MTSKNSLLSKREQTEEEQQQKYRLGMVNSKTVAGAGLITACFTSWYNELNDSLRYDERLIGFGLHIIVYPS